MDGVYDVMNEHLGEYLTYDADATCDVPLTKGSNLCLSDGVFRRCRDDDEEDSTDNTDNTDNTDSNNDNDDNSNNDDNNSDDSNTDNSNTNDDDESAAVRLSMGSMPMAVFWGVGQVFRAVGLMNGQ